jgi:small Trp-rich protein
MYLVLVGVLLLVLKLVGVSPVWGWSWWIVLSPFGAAALWWIIADQTGITQRDAMRRDEERAKRRREVHAENLGLKPRPGERPDRRSGLPPEASDPHRR